MSTVYLLAGANLLLSLCVIASCICRLGVGSALTVRPTVRIKYVALLAGAMASGLAPILFGEYPGIGACGLTAATLLSLVIEMHRWRHGAPPDVRTDYGLLGPPEERRLS